MDENRTDEDRMDKQTQPKLGWEILVLVGFCGVIAGASLAVGLMSLKRLSDKPLVLPPSMVRPKIPDSFESTQKNWEREAKAEELREVRGDINKYLHELNFQPVTDWETVTADILKKAGEFKDETKPNETLDEARDRFFETLAPGLTGFDTAVELHPRMFGPPEFSRVARLKKPLEVAEFYRSLLISISNKRSQNKLEGRVKQLRKSAKAKTKK